MLRTLISGGNDVGSPEFSLILRLSGSTIRAVVWDGLISAAAWLRDRGTAEAAVATAVVLPGGLAVFEAQGQSVPTLYDFARQRKVRAVLLNLGARHLNLVFGLKHHAHIV